LRAAQDDDLADVAGDEIGRSLAALSAGGFAGDLRAADLHVMVRHGMDEGLGR
jgi:hypothetical protein